MKKQIEAAKKTRKKKQAYPAGWDEEKVRDVLAHYENQTEEEQLAEHEAAFADPGNTVMVVPTELVPEIRALIAAWNQRH